MVFTQKEVGFVMQVSKSRQQNYFENQQSGEKKKKNWGFITCITNFNKIKNDTVENITCSTKPCQINKNLFIDCNVVSIRFIINYLKNNFIW